MLNYPGLSILNIYLEWTYGIRSANDIKTLFEQDPAALQILSKAQADYQPTHLWEKLTIDALLLVWPLLFGFLLWVSFKQLSLGVSFGTSVYLYAALVLTYELIYILSASVVIMAAAEILANFAHLIIFELWILGTIPKVLGLSILRCALIGNGSYILLGIMSYTISQMIYFG